MSNDISVRLLYSLCGVLALLLGAATLWLNSYGGFSHAPWLCGAGLCEAEVLARSARLTTIAGQGGPAIDTGLLRRDAASPLTWSNAAFAYQKAGDHAKARYCAQRAFELGGGSAPLLMRVLHFHLGEGSREDVLRTGKVLLGLVRDYDEFVFRYYEAVESRPVDVLGRGMPGEQAAAASYLRNRTAAADVDGAAQTWAWMKSRSLVTEPALNSYVAFLMRHDAVDESRQAWDEYHAAERAPFPNNLIFNPDFRVPPSKGPYDWRMSEIAGATVEVDHAAREGKGALKIEFRGEENIDFQHVGQTIPVSRRPLRLKAKVKCEGLTTNEGVAIRVFDREAPVRFTFTTEQLTGTRDWTQWDYPLAIPAGTRLLELRIVRQRSQKFDNKIKGTAWFSAMSLEAEAK